ncbi:MAG: iron export ABC transporter permease subunit FetB [Symploca sp. SIO1C4]|uniref:Iron export ABC transporter permease subunit FetB n=1 Tax=Symploca sp. SIO1C4 TaxID=2607765 RepID=A0A6B3NJI1_9CYAN|nr:iron export ABC transporter permease subunit FetB [Symploca sp. SIO1C4]
MESSYIPISNWQLVGATALIVINVALSFALKLGLGQRLGIAAMRMVVQLLLVGYVLEWVFTLQSPLLVLLLTLLMSVIAGSASVNRTRRRFAGIYGNSFISIAASAALVTGLTVEGIIQVEPWYNPQYLITLLGMVLGNAVTGTSLALDRFMEELNSHREQVEALLALGATRWEAAHGTVREALRTGMIPTINSMMVMGLVSLPGMMTGQILAGAFPTDAVRYQILIIFTIAAGTALACLGIILLAFRALFSPQHQLRLERLHKTR